MKLIFRKLILFLTFLVLLIFLSACGLYEYYYLPQVQEGNRGGYTIAEIALPNLNSSSLSDMYYYARGYNIFYKIYISNYIAPGTITPTELSLINQALLTDYNYFLPYTDPANNTLITTLRTFSDRNFYMLELDENEQVISVLTPNGGLLSIFFTDNSPRLVIDGVQHLIYRASFSDYQNRSFLYSDELNIANEYTIDVAKNNNSGSAYVLMYLVTTGLNYSNFTQILSKPVLLNIFKLP